MEDGQNVKIGETPHLSSRSSRGLYDSVDSGYQTLTPHSGSCTPVVSGCRSHTKRNHRTRTPWQSDRAPRHRSKLNHFLNVCDPSSDSVVVEGANSQSLSSDQHALSSDFQSISSESSDYRNIGAELRELRSRTRRNVNKTTVPITPATRLQLLSPPPSPAIPSSSFMASEPIEEDVEMKLVIVPQSTPHLTSSSPCGMTPLPSVTFSPTTSKPSITITSVENQKLSKLKISELSTAEIRPKRLDFSQRVFSMALHRTRAMPDYTGEKNVDLLALLGEKSNHWRIVSRILGLLSAQDLCAISMVSKVWRRICVDDSRANMRRLSHIILRQNAKENLKLIRKTKMEGDIQTSPKSRYPRKGYLLQVQNLLQLPSNPPPPNSPPVSPSKVKFHSFVKASRTLEPWEHLLRCPRCSFPCHVNGEKNIGTCSRQGCSMEFCTSCSSRPHAGPCKTPLLATPTKRNKRLVVGSRQSKRNLRRL